MTHSRGWKDDRPRWLFCYCCLVVSFCFSFGGEDIDPTVLLSSTSLVTIGEMTESLSEIKERKNRQTGIIQTKNNVSFYPIVNPPIPPCTHTFKKNKKWHYYEDLISCRGWHEDRHKLDKREERVLVGSKRCIKASFSRFSLSLFVLWRAKRRDRYRWCFFLCFLSCSRHVSFRSILLCLKWFVHGVDRAALHLVGVFLCAPLSLPIQRPRLQKIINESHPTYSNRQPSSYLALVLPFLAHVWQKKNQENEEKKEGYTDTNVQLVRRKGDESGVVKW